MFSSPARSSGVGSGFGPFGHGCFGRRCRRGGFFAFILFVEVEEFHTLGFAVGVPIEMAPIELGDIGLKFAGDFFGDELSALAVAGEFDVVFG